MPYGKKDMNMSLWSPEFKFRDFALISSKTKIKEKEMVAKVRKMH